MKLVISGGWSYGNIGDEVIAKSTIELFNEIFPKTEIFYTSYNPNDFKKAHQKDSFESVHKIIKDKVKKISDFEIIKNNINEYGLKTYSQIIDNNTIFIMSGGGYFSENWTSQFVARLIELYIASKNGAKIIVIGQSIGPVYTNYGKKLLKEMLDLCDYLSVRDVSTKGFLESLNLNVDVDCNPDVAVTISDYTPKQDKERCINLMPAAYTTYRKITSGRKIKIIEKIRKRLTFAGISYKIQWKRLVKILSSEYKIKFVMSVNWKSDQKFVNFLTDHGKLKNFEIANCESAEDLCHHLSQGSMIISTKMHPIIVSMSYGIPAVAVSYDFKVDDFMKMVGKNEWCFRNYKINVKKIKEIVDLCMNDKNNITVNCDKAKKQVYTMMEKIKENFYDLES